MDIQCVEVRADGRGQEALIEGGCDDLPLKASGSMADIENDTTITRRPHLVK